MNQLVIDASVTLSWLLPDEDDEKALSSRNDLLSAELIWAPGHWRLEVANALWMAERRKRLDAAGLAQAVALVSQIPTVIDTETSVHATAETLSLARQHEISVYDAAYLELAMRRGAALSSLDGALRKIAERVGVTVRPQ